MLKILKRIIVSYSKLFSVFQRKCN